MRVDPNKSYFVDFCLSLFHAMITKIIKIDTVHWASDI